MKRIVLVVDDAFDTTGLTPLLLTDRAAGSLLELLGELLALGYAQSAVLPPCRKADDPAEST